MAKATAAEKRYQAKVRELGCIVDIQGINSRCRTPASIHHAFTGAGGRKNEMLVLPICPYHHTGIEGLHTLGRKTWAKLYGTEHELIDRVNGLLAANVD